MLYCPNLGNPAKSALTLSRPLTHTGRPIIVGLKALVASLVGTTLIAAKGIGADGTVRGTHRGELGTFIFIWWGRTGASKTIGGVRKIIS